MHPPRPALLAGLLRPGLHPQLAHYACIVVLHPFLRQATVRVIAEDIDKLPLGALARRRDGAKGRFEGVGEDSRHRGARCEEVAILDDRLARHAEVPEGRPVGRKRRLELRVSRLAGWAMEDEVGGEKGIQSAVVLLRDPGFANPDQLACAFAQAHVVRAQRLSFRQRQRRIIGSTGSRAGKRGCAEDREAV